jgi:hypothetical protein
MSNDRSALTAEQHQWLLTATEHTQFILERYPTDNVRPKFRFPDTGAIAVTSTTSTRSTSTTDDDVVGYTQQSTDDQLVHLHHQHLITAQRYNNLAINDLRGSRVWIHGEGCSLLHASNILESELTVVPVLGAAYLCDSRESVFVIAAQQIRMHNLHDCKLYLLTNTPPIMENCSNVAVAPLPASLHPSKGIIQTNCWDQVQDFNWLKLGQISPHWRILEPEERAAPRKPATN